MSKRTVKFTEDELAIVERFKYVPKPRAELLLNLCADLVDRTNPVQWVHETCIKHGLDQRRFIAMVTTLRKLSGSVDRYTTDESLVANLAITHHAKLVRAAAALQQFVNETLQPVQEATTLHHTRLEAWFVMALESACVLRGWPLWHYAVKRLTKPQEIVEAAWPEFIANGIWLGQAKVIAGLATHLSETPNSISGDEWSVNWPGGFDKKYEEYLAKEDAAERERQAYFAKIDRNIERNRGASK